MSKTYIVTGTFTEEVEADNPQEAEAKAIESYMDNPDTDYQVEEVKTCPACNLNQLKVPDVRNSLSRYYDKYICSDCGTREALEGKFW